jgi:predicted cobalt transporter CbtA
MMEGPEVPLEHLQEEIHHHAQHDDVPWISWVALSTAILAVLAAISGLLAGMHANEAMMAQIQASDQWGYYQAKSIKAAILEAKTTLASEATARDKEKAAQYQEEQAKIQREAEHKESEAKANFHKHEVFARSVTMFQIAIAIAAISALTKKRRFWFVSLAFGLAGVVFLLLGSIAH